MKTYAYCRVSAADQNEIRQITAFTHLNIPKQQVFTDRQSGKDFIRPAYLALIKKLRQGDLLYIKSIDRLGRNYTEILEQWRVLTKEKGIDIVVLDMLPLLDTRNGRDLVGTFIADSVLAVLSFVAQKEREDIRARQREGIIAAKARGVRFGRPIKKPAKDFSGLMREWKRGNLSTKDFCAKTGLSQSTIYRRLKEYRAGTKNKGPLETRGNL